MAPQSARANASFEVRGKHMSRVESTRCVVAIAAAIALSAASLAHAKHDELAQIKALEDAQEKAANARDLDGVMAAYVDDGSLFVFDVVPPRQYIGAAAYRESWKALLAGPLSYRTSDLFVEAHGGLAYGHKILHATGTDPQGHTFDLTARVTDVYRKIDEKWRIVQEHVSVPVDVTTGKADLTSAP
jgi:ketosteroid isomerase-like protein